MFNILLQPRRWQDHRQQGARGELQNTVIIMTSNNVAPLLLQGITSEGEIRRMPGRRDGELRRSFRPEFLNRWTTLSSSSPSLPPKSGGSSACWPRPCRTASGAEHLPGDHGPGSGLHRRRGLRSRLWRTAAETVHGPEHRDTGGQDDHLRRGRGRNGHHRGRRGGEAGASDGSLR